MNHNIVLALGVVLLALIGALCAVVAGRSAPIELRGWALRAPAPSVALPQIVLAVVDLALSALVLWLLLPASSDVEPAGIRRRLCDRHHRRRHQPRARRPGRVRIADRAGAAERAGRSAARARCWPGARSITCCRCWWRRCCSAARSCAASARRWRASSSWRRPTSRRSCRRSPAHWCSLAGFLLLVSGATPSIDQRLAVLRDILPLVVLELSHLAGSVIGLALLILARALFRRVAAAYQLTVWLLAAGMVTSLLRGLEIEQALLLGVVLLVLWLGPARVLPAGADPGAALHAGLDRQPGDRDLDRGVDRILRLPARRLFALAVVDVRVRGRRAAHAARLAAGGAAGGGVPGDEPAAAGAARAGRRLGRRSDARARR